MVFLAFVSFLSTSVYILGFLYKSELLLEKEISFCISSSSGEFFFMLVFDLKSGLFKFCVVLWFVDQWYFSVPYMYFCQGDSHWIPFFLLQAAKGLVPDKVVSRTMCKREYHCLLKGEKEHSSPPSLPPPHLIMCLDDAKSNWMQKNSSWA